jgi:maleamate amidohydrolase
VREESIEGETTRSQTVEALLLIDFQCDFLADDARMPVARDQVEPVMKATRAAVDRAKVRGDLVVLIGNEYKRRDFIGNVLRHHAAVAGSTGSKWDSRFEVDGAMYLPKWKADAFCNPSLRQILVDHGIQRVALAGLFAKACVSATAKSAKAQGFDVFLVQDAIACGSESSRATAIERLNSIGITSREEGER